MTKFRKGFRSHREEVGRINAAFRFLGMDDMQTKLAPKRERAVPVQREAPVVAAISELLAVHPRVIWAARFNSGMASYEAKSGKYAPVWFHKFVRMPEKMRMPDFMGLTNRMIHPCLESGVLGQGEITTICLLAIEAKAPGWTKPTDDREREQAAFLKMIRECGGIGIFATSVDDVAKSLG